MRSTNYNFNSISGFLFNSNNIGYNISNSLLIPVIANTFFDHFGFVKLNYSRNTSTAFQVVVSHFEIIKQ